MSLATFEHHRGVAPQVIHDMALDADALRRQVAIIHQAQEAVMKPKIHYDKIPGCGGKPVLLKPGAEIIALTFQFAASYDESITELGSEHREYHVKCTLTHRGTGGFIGQGIGSCSTKETKYRYRSGEGAVSDVPIPKGYWDARNTDPKKAAAMLVAAAHAEGLEGEKFGTKKDGDGAWRISTHGERVEHDNPADYYNTCLKMAKKRAYVDVILTSTAASDVFTQDIDDAPEAFGGKKQETKPKQQAAKPRPKNHTPLNIETIRAEANSCTTVERLESYFKSLNLAVEHPDYAAVVDICAEVKNFIQSAADAEAF